MKKYNMLGLNVYTGNVIEVAFNDPKNFSRDCFKDTLLIPNTSKNKEALEGIIRKNAGARGFFERLAQNFNVEASIIDDEIEELEKIVLQYSNSKHTCKNVYIHAHSK